MGTELVSEVLTLTFGNTTPIFVLKKQTGKGEARTVDQKTTILNFVSPYSAG